MAMAKRVRPMIILPASGMAQFLTPDILRLLLCVYLRLRRRLAVRVAGSSSTGRGAVGVAGMELVAAMLARDQCRASADLSEAQAVITIQVAAQ
jgi:hypothetical protein